MPDNCNPNDCPLEPRITALERANEQHGNTHRELFKRMNEAERVNDVQNVHYKGINKKLDEISATVKTMADKPGKRWEALVEKALWAVAAAVIAFLLGRVGL